MQLHVGIGFSLSRFPFILGLSKQSFLHLEQSNLSLVLFCIYFILIWSSYTFVTRAVKERKVPKFAS